MGMDFIMPPQGMLQRSGLKAFSTMADLINGVVYEPVIRTDRARLNYSRLWRAGFKRADFKFDHNLHESVRCTVFSGRNYLFASGYLHLARRE